MRHGHVRRVKYYGKYVVFVLARVKHEHVHVQRHLAQNMQHNRVHSIELRM